MGAEKDFPRGLFEAYAERRITRTHFEFVFAEWQRRHGMNYNCKGTADMQGLYVTYRGVTATVQGGRLVWRMGVNPAVKRLRRTDMRSAESVSEFRRKVDFALREEYLWKGGFRCREIT